MEPLSLVCFGVWLVGFAVSLHSKNKNKNNNKKANRGFPRGESVLHDGDVKKKNGNGGCGCGGGERAFNELVQPQLPTAMLKVHFGCCCDGCPKKIQEVVTQTIGYHQIDQANGQVTVEGSITDMNALAKQLELQLKKYVEIVPLSPQKEDEKKDKKRNGGAGEENRNKDKNSKPPVTTAVLKAPGESLKQQLKKDVKIVVTKEDGQEKENKCGCGGDSGGDVEEKRKSGGDKKAKDSVVDWCTFVGFIADIFQIVIEFVSAA